MPDLIDMARTPADKEKEARRWDEPQVNEMPDYPYGLSISLEDEACKKLGLDKLDEDSPVNITATGMISNYSVMTINGEKKMSVTIQLQKMSVSGESDKDDPADTLYGSAKLNTVSMDG